MTLFRQARALRKPSPRNALTLVAVGAVTVALVGVPGRTAAAPPTPPPNPSDAQLHSAAAEKAALAQQVGRLGAAVTAAQSRLNQLQAAQEAAEQKLAYRLQLVGEAKQAATRARQRVDRARQAVEAAQATFSAYVQSAYMSGSVGGSASALLTAPDPSAILQQSALTEYEAEHQIDAIGALRQATVERSNAEAAARRAVQREKAAAQAAGRAKDDADAAVTAGIVEEKSVEQQLADNQAALSSAQERLATLNGQRQAYLAWQKRQAEIRAAREAARRKAEEEARQARLRELARERAQRLREARQRELAREERQRELAREAARQRSSADAPVTVRTSRDSGGSSHHHHHHGGGSSGGSSGGGGGSSGEGSSGGGSSGGGSSSGGYSGWTAAKGRIAVHRAMRYLGWSYAWAGGNAYGPTYGVCAAGSAWNDCHIQGFDCSGLTLYGWAPFIGLDHYTVTQYSQAGSYHPSLSDLRAGDLLFWSSNGSISGIHHVAMYIGNGNVIQAPESGSVIQITPMYSVDWGYFGATRPLT